MATKPKPTHLRINSRTSSLASFSTSQQPPLPVHFLYYPGQKSEASSKIAYSFTPTCLHSNPQVSASEHGDLRTRGASARICRGSVAPTLRLGFTGGEVYVASSLRRIQPCSLYPRDGEYTRRLCKGMSTPILLTWGRCLDRAVCGIR